MAYSWVVSRALLKFVASGLNHSGKKLDDQKFCLAALLTFVLAFFF
jgi:hypothetical protein